MHRLSRLRDIAGVINAGGDVETILDRVLFAVCRGEPWSRGGIMAVNQATGFSERLVSYQPGEAHRTPDPARWPLATSPVLAVAQSRLPLVIADAQLSAEHAGYREDARQRGYRTVVLLPLGCSSVDEHELVMSIHTRERVDVTEEELEFLATVAQLVAIAVDKRKHLQRERRQNERLRHTMEGGARLMELVLGGATTPVAGSAASALLPHPFVVLDFEAGSTLVHGSPLPDRLAERGWRDLVEGPAGPLLAALAHRCAGGTMTALDLTAAGFATPLPVCVEPLRVDDEVAGALLIFPRGAALDGLDRLAAQEVRFALSAQIMRQHAAAKQEALDLSDVFAQLCRDGAADAARLRRHAARLGWDLARSYHLAAVALPGPLAASNQLRRVLGSGVAARLPGALAIAQDDAVAVLLPYGHGASPPDALLDRLLVEPVRHRWGVRPLAICGPVCAAPTAYGAAWAECLRVLRLARMFARDGLLRQADFGPSALLLSALDAPLVQAFVEDTLGPLHRQEAGQGGWLLRTATAFVDLGCRYQATAEHLGIHVSTLRYRLGRLQELFGLDLEDAEIRFRFSLAARLAAMAAEPSSGS